MRSLKLPSMMNFFLILGMQLVDCLIICQYVRLLQTNEGILIESIR